MSLEFNASNVLKMIQELEQLKALAEQDLVYHCQTSDGAARHTETVLQYIMNLGSDDLSLSVGRYALIGYLTSLESLICYYQNNIESDER